ncbi:MAG: DUF115 domain-containing protein [Spirochaetaceae bacterium]|jgi:hypothetical protein|nr:DUF115 domain-containing protein [Spirochaetaceae bacterium]
MTALTYEKIVPSQAGPGVPVFANGRAMYSLRNPQRDADAFAGALGDSPSGFAVVFGLGTGLHIEALLKKRPGLKVLAVEASADNIAFLRPFLVRGIEGAVLCPAEDLYRVFLSSYVPLLDGNVTVLFQQAWKNAHPEVCLRGEAVLAKALEAAKNDVATQAHFGKLWHRNILLNIRAMEAAGEGGRLCLPRDREALVAAAGPTLEDAIGPLAQNRENTFVIAADTAYLALLRKGITPDAVVTIDGQGVSVNHFMRGIRGVLFADLCANPAVPRLFYGAGRPVVFFRNGHPLGELAASYAKERGAPEEFLPLISAGAGTVTASAWGAARRGGFSTITLAGADFSFPRNRPYAGGVYLEDSFFPCARRTAPAETAFTGLMFRGATCPSPEGGTLTTPLLLSFRRSLEKLTASPPEALDFFSTQGGFLGGFISWYKNHLEEALASGVFQGRGDPLVSSCLPLLAWARGQKSLFGQKQDIFSALKLAQTAAARYTIPQ